MNESFPPSIGFPLASRPRVVRLLLLLLFLCACFLWFSSRALLTANFLPHWYCLAGNSRLLWTTVIGDLLIGLSYVVISATLVRILRGAGQDLPYQGFFWAFGLFIVSCGITHFLEILTIWQPFYWLAAAVKILTAVSSVGTAVVLVAATGDIISFARTARQLAIGRGHERFRALFMATPLAVISFDLDGLVTSWNPGAEKMFGFREADILGRPNPIIPQELMSEHRRLLKNTLAGSITTGQETIRQCLDGARIPVTISAAPLFDIGGKQIGVMSAIEDISERKRMELELQEKGSALLAVTQALNVYLDSGNWQLASRELLSFAIQHTGSEYGFLGVVLDHSRLRFLAHDGATWDATIDCSHVRCPIQPTPENATTIENKESSFQKLHNLFAQVILSGHTVIANDISSQASPRSEANSRTFPTRHAPLESFLGMPVFKGSEVAGFISVANRAGGYSRTESNSLETMSGATGILQDNYRRSLKRAALQEKQVFLDAQVQQSRNLDLLARVAAGFAHDFNNLLMILSGASELLDHSLAPESLSRVYVGQIQQSTARAAGITRQLLAFSRKQVLDLQPMELHAALTGAQSVLSHLLGPAIELKFSLEADLSWICSDMSQIERVILNLASNARDAMPGGGQLTISTRNTHEIPVIAPASSNTAKWLALEVRDTGTGMDKPTLAQIFEPFFTTKPIGKGPGLGLSAVYGIVRQSGGFVQARSEPSKGACFEIYFPAIAPPAAFALTFASPTRSPLPETATVLLVDDEPALVHAIGEFLRDCGYIVLDAFSAQDALDLAREHPAKIDLLVTDVVMPQLRGPDLHRQVIELQPNIRVLFMSGYADGLPEMKLPVGALFLQKPFPFSALLEMLRHLQSRH